MVGSADFPETLKTIHTVLVYRQREPHYVKVLEFRPQAPWQRANCRLLGGRDYYLGPHGTKVSKIEYDRLIGEWLA